MTRKARTTSFLVAVSVLILLSGRPAALHGPDWLAGESRAATATPQPAETTTDQPASVAATSQPTTGPATSRSSPSPSEPARDMTAGWPSTVAPTSQPPDGGDAQAASSGGPSLRAASEQGEAGREKEEARSRFGNRATTRPSTELPSICYEDLALLVKTARRAFGDRVEGGIDRPASYRPPALSRLKGIVHLTLRLHGAVLAEAQSEEMDVIDAAVAAGVLLGQSAIAKKAKLAGGGEECGIEFEFLGPPEFLEAKYGERMTWSDELLHAFEPAVEGIGVEFDGRRGWTRPSQIVSSDYSPDLALQAAETAVGLTHAQKIRFEKRIRYFRFRAYHLWQPDARSLPVVLLRGAELVPEDAVTADGLDAAIDRMGAYLHYRQNRDGWFSHEYLPSTDRYGSGNSAVVQMEALYGLAAYAAWSKQPEVVSDVQKGVRRSALFLRPPSVVTGAAEGGRPQIAQAGLLLVFPGHEDGLGASARLLAAVLALGSAWQGPASLWEAPATQPFAADVASGRLPSPAACPAQDVSDCVSGLMRGLLSGEEGAGASSSSAGDAEQDATRGRDEVAAAWALLAALRADDWLAGQDVGVEKRLTADDLERRMRDATAYYERNLDEAAGPVAAAVLVGVFQEIYRRTNDARASDLVFGITDRFVQLQIDEGVCPWPELYGAINARDRGVIGVDTANYLSALSEGLALAERIGDRDRAKRYRRAVRLAARFILQLEVRESGCYYVRNPRDALGGVQAAPWDNRLRVDRCADGLLSLISARRALFGEPGS